MSSHIILRELLTSLDELPTYELVQDVMLPGSKASEFFEKLTRRIQVAAKRIVKTAKGNVGLLKDTSFYANLDDAKAFRAAVTVEIMRVSYLLRNAGHVDAAAMQQLVLQANEADESELTFELAWGQAKRDAGLLKTVGFGADLAELLAISRILVLCAATQLVYDKPVKCRIIGGGNRFYGALFTDPSHDSEYNLQRARFVGILGYHDVVTFENSSRYWSTEEITQILESAYSTFSSQNIYVEDLSFGLFNVDWRHVLDPQSLIEPHGHPIPVEIAELFLESPEKERSALIRNLIANVVKPDLSSKYLGDMGLSTTDRINMAHWMSSVASMSAHKYNLIGSGTIRQLVKDKATIILSVVNKRGETHIPRFMPLGRRTPDLLPQHVVPIIVEDRKVTFKPYLACVRNAKPVRIGVEAESELDFSWLGPEGQPFCLMYSSGGNISDALLNLDPFEE